jgi:myo-inositol-1(or 4)-monophosphatase
MLFCISMDSYYIYMEFAKSLAREAGVIASKYFGSTATVKKDGSALTIADTTINSLVVKRVRETFVDHSVLGEEESFGSAESEFVWVCDPIDGTRPFMMGVPTFVFSLALCKNGEVIIGVIYDPFLDKMFFASLGGGAYCNQKRLQIENWTDFIFGMPVHVDCYPLSPFDLTLVHNAFIHQGNLCLQHHSICYTSMCLAQNTIQAVVFAGTYAYDVAAVSLILSEGGAKVTDLSGNMQRYDRPVHGLIASSPRLYDAVFTLVQKHIKENQYFTLEGTRK